MSRFAYRISIGWDVFVISAVTMLLIAFVTIGFHTIKAALNNPVQFLRYE
ncbi:hypothetical protein JNL27_03700 [bacterium]|nr:hypothetical protein [bacterium]